MLDDVERLRLEWLYHRIRADEREGIRLFQTIAEELVRYRLIHRLRELLSDVTSYADELSYASSKLWLEYYVVRTRQFESALASPEQAYQTFTENGQAEAKLRGYAFSDLAMTWNRTAFLTADRGFERLAHAISESNRLVPETDYRRVLNTIVLGDAYWRLGQFEDALKHCQEAVAEYERRGDRYGLASVHGTMIAIFAVQGDWHKMISAREEGLRVLPASAQVSAVRANLMGGWSVGWVWAGRYADAEANALASLTIRSQLGEGDISGALRDAGYAAGMQDKFADAERYFVEALDNHKRSSGLEDPRTLSFRAAVRLRQGDLAGAETDLIRSQELKQERRHFSDVPETLSWFGLLYELSGDWDKALESYCEIVRQRQTNRRYFACLARAALVRVQYARGRYRAIPPLVEQAEQLAKESGYDDQLAVLRLYQGHLAWASQVTTWGAGFEPALRLYQEALAYGLRFNRFLLDEVLAGRPNGTPMRSIVEECRTRGEAGRRMLTALQTWWRRAVNDLPGAPATVSQAAAEARFLDAELAARRREPGTGSPQRKVLEQLDDAILDAGQGPG